jgi:hypothetical protein
MCRVESIGDLDAQIEHRLDRHRLASDPVPECLALPQFHGDECSPVGLIDFADRADVRVVQRGRSLGFPLKAAEGLCVVGEFVGKKLQGDMATELEVFRLVHDAHATAADLAEDAVKGDRLTYGLGGRGHWLDIFGAVLSKGQLQGGSALFAIFVDKPACIGQCALNCSAFDGTLHCIPPISPIP